MATPFVNFNTVKAVQANLPNPSGDGVTDLLRALRVVQLSPTLREARLDPNDAYEFPLAVPARFREAYVRYIGEGYERRKANKAS